MCEKETREYIVKIVLCYNYVYGYLRDMGSNLSFMWMLGVSSNSI